MPEEVVKYFIFCSSFSRSDAIDCKALQSS